MMNNIDKKKSDLDKLIREVMFDNFYGKIEITFENGVPLIAKQIKSIKFGLDK